MQHENALALIEKYRKERMGFAAAEEAAKRHKVPSLSVLLGCPIGRIDTYIEQLQRLQERTPLEDFSCDDILIALNHFRKVKSSIDQGLRMNVNRAKCEKIGRSFSPRISLATSTRYCIYKGKLNRMEKGNSKPRLLFLFNDILVCARKSDWLDRGHLRHKGTLTLHSYGNNADFGPTAFYVKGINGEKWNCICPSLDVYKIWMENFSMCSTVICVNRSESHVSIRSSNNNNDTPSSSNEGSQLPSGWIKLIDESSGNKYYYNREKQKTQWEFPNE